MSRPNTFFIVILSVYTLSMRLLPYALSHFGVKINPAETFYPWNFSPMSAFCLFGAAYFAQKRWAFFLPVALLFAGDLGIWALSGHVEWAFHKNMLTVYGCFLLIAVLGMSLRGTRSLPTVWAMGLAGETLFFLITNFGVWYFASSDPGRLTEFYVRALPFFGKSVLSTLFFSAVIFSPFMLHERKAQAIATESKSAAT